MALTDYVIMPGEDYQAICDAVREKRNETEVIKSGEIAGKIQGIETADVDWLAKFIGEARIEAANVEQRQHTVWYTDSDGNKRYYTNIVQPTMGYAFYECASLTTVPLFDTSKVVDMDGMFKSCSSLTTVPLFDMNNVTTTQYMFETCTSLTTVPLFNMSNVTHAESMFENCISLTTVPLFDLSNLTYAQCMFENCGSLTTVPLFDVRKLSNASYIFRSCYSLTECWLRNIKTNLQVGQGTSWGHLLTLDSLIHLIYECRDTGSVKTLTVGSANLEKLANVYVRTIEITDEMRAEDDLIDEKLPFEVCESTDEGAILIVDYAVEKNWSIK